MKNSQGLNNNNNNKRNCETWRRQWYQLDFGRSPKAGNLGCKNYISEEESKLSRPQYCQDLLEYWEESWWLKENYYHSYRLIGPVAWVFANDPGDLGSIPGCVIPKTLKIVFDTSLLNTQQYKVRIEGKVEQSRESSSALPYISV